MLNSASPSLVFASVCGLLTCVTLAVTPVAAQEKQGHGTAHHGMDHSGRGQDMDPAAAGYAAAMDRMMAAMDVPATGDADVDFITGMIAHHQGAVDAARIVLEHGRDAEVKAFALQIIDAQEAEIAFMQEWLARHSQ